MVTLKIPAPPKGLGTNLLGLAGLVAMVVAIGGLTGNWWWSLLAAGAVSVVLTVLAQHNAPETLDESPTQQIPRIGAA